MSLHSYANPYTVAAQSENVRSEFIRKTYAHLGGALVAFALLETALLSIPGIDGIVFGILGALPFSWLLVLGAFMIVSTIAEKWANNATSLKTQYFGLGLYIAAEALIFLPLMIIALRYFGASLLLNAALITGGLVAGITTIAFTTKKDFSFMGGALKIIGWVALGLIALSFIPGLGITLGTWFTVAMIIFASGCILYTTSNIIHRYGTQQYVAASLSLFASVALLLWYVIQLLMSLSSDD